MVGIICTTLSPRLHGNSYKTPKQNKYHFQLGGVTEIKDKEDAAFFLDKRHNGGFIASTVKQKIKDKVKETAENIVDKTKEKLTGKKPDRLKEKQNKLEDNKILEEAEIWRLDKKEQVELIKKLGGKNTVIPNYEKFRVKLILKLQEEKK